MPSERGEASGTTKEVPAIEDATEDGGLDTGSAASELASRGTKRASSTPQPSIPDKRRKTGEHTSAPAPQPASNFDDRLTPDEDEASPEPEEHDIQTPAETPETRAWVYSSATSPFPEHRGAFDVQEEEIKDAQRRSQEALIRRLETRVAELEDDNRDLQAKLDVAAEKLASRASSRPKRQRK